MLRAALTAAALVGAAVAVPAAAAPAQPEAFVLSGPGGVQATFAIGEQRNLGAAPFELVGGNGYVAVDLRHSDGAHGAQAAVVRVFGTDHAGQVQPGTDRTLPKGRYTLTLIADGPATVTVRLSGGSGTQQLPAAHAVPSSIATGTAAVPSGTGAGRVVLPGAVPAGRSAFLMHYLSSGVRAGGLEKCATSGRTCQESPLSIDYRVAGVGNKSMRRVAPEPAGRNAVTAVDGVRSAGDVLRAATISYG